MQEEGHEDFSSSLGKNLLFVGCSATGHHSLVTSLSPIQQ